MKKQPFATLEDLEDHWPNISNDLLDEAAQKLIEASILIRGLYPQTDARIESGTLGSETVTYIVCDMVKEALNEPAERPSGDVSQMSFSAGPFTQGMSFRERERNLFLKKIHRQLLTGGGTRNRKAFNIMPGGV